MSAFPGSPQVLKGAIVGLDRFNPLASIVIFQYNPDTLTRTVRAQAAGADGSQSEALRLKGPPEETIRFDIEVDAADQMERGDAVTGAFGVAPALAALEMLLYPKSALVIANEVLAKLGAIEVIPPEAPLTLLFWGMKRVVPVRLTELTITEDAFDPSLNPIRAKVGISVRVLTYDDLGLLSGGGAQGRSAGPCPDPRPSASEGDVFDTSSRYATVPDATMTIVEPDGMERTIRFKRRRFLPSPSTMTVLVEHTVTDGERLDVITARYIGDPTQFWRVCDANGVFRPAGLTDTAGTIIDIASPAP